MVKVSAPCLSLGASGKLGGALVFSTWKGRPYVRELVKPANPRSGGQVGVRAMFKFLSQNWAALAAAHKTSWESRADDAIVSTFNAFMGFNMARWRNFTSPSMNSTLDAGETLNTWAGASATAGVRQITISKQCTVHNDGWGLIIHRALTTGFTPSFSNAVAVILANDAATWTYVDTPLDPDEYFYNFTDFTSKGVSALEDDEVDDIVV